MYSYHDQRVFTESSLGEFERNRTSDGFCLIGDKGYSNTQFLMSPFKVIANLMKECRGLLKGNTTPAETRFNDMQSSGRCVNENVMRRLKAAFPILGRLARVDPETLSKTVAAAIVLYNLRFIITFLYTPRSYITQ